MCSTPFLPAARPTLLSTLASRFVDQSAGRGSRKRGAVSGTLPVDHKEAAAEGERQSGFWQPLVRRPVERPRWPGWILGCDKSLAAALRGTEPRRT